jgi:hypothetical protein
MWETTLWCCGSLLFGYVVTSFLESWYHENLQHSSLTSRWGSVYNRLKPNARFSHTVIHHQKTFVRDHVTQFRSEEDRIAVEQFIDASTDATSAKAIREERFGTHWNTESIFLVVVVIWVPILLFAPLFGRFIVFALLPVFPVLFFSTFCHRYLHMKKSEALLECKDKWMMRWFLSSRYGSYLYHYHFMHHKYATCNFNFLIGGDFWRGKHRVPTEKDVVEMRKIDCW